MENKLYHHLKDGTFRNPEGSPVRDMKFNWSYKVFNEEKKKLDMSIPKDHVIEKSEVIKLPAGQIVVYPSTYLHSVEKVPL